MHKQTGIYKVDAGDDEEIRRVLLEVHAALNVKGYNPIAQVTGYILSEDPTYITTYDGARIKMSKLDRDDILVAMVRWYLADATFG